MCYYFLRISNCCRRHPTARLNLIVAVACFVYFVFALHQVHSVHTPDGRPDQSQRYRTGRGVYSVLHDDPLAAPEPPTGQNTGVLPDLESHPTRSNVVYITLRTKRLKPAIIRGTVRPKVRRKGGKRAKYWEPNPLETTIDKAGQVERGEKRDDDNDVAWSQIGNMGFNSILIHKLNTVDTISSIRIYSEKAPPWLTRNDIDAMRFLAESAITRIGKVQLPESQPLLLFESTAERSPDDQLCRGRCGVIKRSIDMCEVFAFHLDRVLNLNMSLPAVGRRFQYLEDLPCPVVLWDPSLSAVSNSTPPTPPLTWGSYQRLLKHRCWIKGLPPKPEWGCTDIHHYEWGKLALFDFLLQVDARLDKGCCGFRPRPEDSCVQLGHHQKCADPDGVELAHIVHRKHDRRHIVLVNNKGFFDRDVDNLDYRLLVGIKEFPEQAVSVLQGHRLRERLLQSLFLDQVYWDSQGGRRGIDKLIDVIERRANILLTYINAHGIKVIPMKDGSFELEATGAPVLLSSK
ncbi:Golgi-associated kinase 1B [Sardina pilchardus]|uniref:Golgi-associated kinase 1B n=1 Tax=Sardina pilchardus TaxID=27697 RepID=UPI002E15AB3A